MDAVPECQMTDLAPVDVEFGRALKLPLVAVCGTDPRHHRCAGGYLNVAQGGVGDRHPVHGLDGGPKAKHFFDGLGEQGRLLHQPIDSAGHLGKAKDRVAYQVCGCFVAGDEQQGAEAQQFSHVQFLPVNLSAEQVADQVIARPPPSLFDEIQEVPGHFPVCCLLVFRRRIAPSLADDDVGPLLEAVPVIGGDTHEFGDHDNRQRVRQLLDQVGATAGNDPVQKLFREFRNAGSKRVHGFRCERLGHQRA
ncbi:hypothetical protein D9M72_501890 [compost metagenome]